VGAVVGVDIGQKRDPSAICVAETDKRQAGGRTEYHYLVRHLDRLPLGTPFPSVARRVGQVLAGVEQRTGSHPHRLYVDATGLGAPIVDLLREQSPTTRIVAVYFNHGDRRVETSHKEVSLGKAYLVSRLQALLQARRIHLPRTSEAEALGGELLDYEIRVDQDANDRYGAFRVGTHDDLVTALGLAVQAEPRFAFFGRAASRSYLRIPV
jgi:hypothetical protein